MTTVDAGRASTFASMAVPNFRRYFLGQSLSSIGTWFHTLALALVVVDLTESGAALGGVVALQWLPLLVFGSYAGAILDRYEPRAVLVVTNSVSAVLGLALVGVTAAGHLDVWSLGVFSLAYGLVLPFDRPAVQVMPVELVPAALVSNALGISSMIQSLARLVGPALAGVAFAALGPSWCFAVNALSYLLATAVLLRLDRAALHPRPRARAERGQVREGFAYLRGNPGLRAVLAVNALVGLLAINFLVVITATVEITFDGGGFAVGVAHSANALGALAGGAIVGATLARLSRRIDLVCLALGAALAVNALAPSLVLFVLAGPLLGITFVAYQSSVLDACHRLARPDMFGRMASLVTLGAMGTTPAGSMIVGVVIDVWSPRAALAMGAASCAVGAVLLGATLLAQRRDAGDAEAVSPADTPTAAIPIDAAPTAADAVS